MTTYEERCQEQLERLHERIDSGEYDLVEQDRKALLVFHKRFLQKRAKDDTTAAHHRNKLNDLVQIAQGTGKIAESLKNREVEEDEEVPWDKQGDDIAAGLARWIKNQGDAEYTQQSRLSSLRVFAQIMLDEFPERFADIEPSSVVDSDPAPLPGNIVEYEHLLRMLEETEHTRDCALFTVAWGGGPRPEKELRDLQRKQIDFEDGYALITLEEDGKTDDHEIAVVVAYPYLKKWIEQEHPAHYDPDESMNPDTYVWTHLYECEQLDSEGIRTRFRVAGDRAGLEVDHVPQHFRRSCISILARQPEIGFIDLLRRFSWSRISNGPWHYIDRYSKPTTQNVLERRGIDDPDIHEEPDVSPVACPNCTQWTVRGLDNCVRCGHDIDTDQLTFETPDIPDRPITEEKSFSEMVLDGEISSNDLRTLRNLEPHIKAGEVDFGDLDGLIRRVEAMEDLEDDNESVASYIGATGTAGTVVKGAVGRVQTWARATHAALKIHPAPEQYPPTGPRLVGLVSTWLVLLGVSVAIAMWAGLFNALAGGSPLLLVATIVSLAIGAGLVHRDLPSVGDAIDAVSERA